MASLNKVLICGKLTRDPQVKFIPSGSATCDLGIAINRSYFDKKSNQKKEDVTFVDVTLWGKTAELAGEHLTKGREVLIEGRLQLDQWEDKETKKKMQKLKVVGENVQFLGGKSDSNTQQRSEPQPASGFDDAPQGDGQQQGDEVPF